MSAAESPIFSIFQIGLAIHKLNKAYEKQLGLSLVQCCLLEELIDMPGTSAFELARAVGVHPSTLTQTLKRLERKGFLFISEDRKDSRRKQVTMTKTGRDALGAARLQMKNKMDDLKKSQRQLEKVTALLHNF